MAKSLWKAIREFSLAEIREPIAGKWQSLYEEVDSGLHATKPPKGIAIEFDNLDEARTAAVSLMRLFRKNHGPKAIRTSARYQFGRPCLLVWRGEAYDQDT